ncbi:SPOR domain-containing protein [Marinospirillum sp. MEB164]|uniref:SPOR domain-containing protein n=1 Tax=Marinospirillum alkalitolerans TaxID=3123374 RepID=A0ABW8PXN9_9GAMM
MAQDFASRQRKRPAESVRSATPTAPPVAAVAPAPSDFWSLLPGWGWLIGGGLLGLLIGVLIASPESTSPPPTVTERQEAVFDTEGVTRVRDAQPEPEAATTEPPARQTARFDFYTLLPEVEVIAPTVEAYQSTPRDASSAPRFMLQVGSFRQLQDAQRLEARLVALGFEQIQIQAVETATGGVWHRVQIGPWQDRRLMARAQDQLARAGIEFMLLRLRDEPTEAAPSAVNSTQ